MEEALLSHPEVLEAGVFAVPHKKLGENVAAVVVLRPEAKVTPEALRQFARKRLAAYKVPSLVRAVAALPKGASGKVKRNALAELIADAPANATETFSECAMSFNVPATDITPQPITKLPNISAQRTVNASPSTRPD